MTTTNPRLVWNKGIAALCDWRVPDEFPEGIYKCFKKLAGVSLTQDSPENLIANPTVFSRIRDGDLVWVRLAWLKSFVRQVLPFITTNFILVTGDADTSVPSEVRFIADELVRDTRLIHWFAQNCDSSAFVDRISPIPIGIDFHTLSERPFWGEEIRSLKEQENELLSIRRGLLPIEERSKKLYADFAFQPPRCLSFMDRRALLAQLREDILIRQHKFMPRSIMWRRRGRYAFVVSPHGFGLDCHRTWEALALGHVVIVPQSPLDTLFDGLNVIAIKDWDKITQQDLDDWLPRYADDSQEIQPPLTSHFWVSKMRALAHMKRSGAILRPVFRRLQRI
jgi:hypothetical protein